MKKIILVLSVLSAFFIGLVSNEVLADESPVTNVSKEEIVLGNAVREYLDTIMRKKNLIFRSILLIQ